MTTEPVLKPCPDCDGDGVIYTGDWFSPKEYCLECGGTGKVKRKTRAVERSETKGETP